MERSRIRQPVEEPPPRMLYVAEGADGKTVSFGQRQAEWLESEGIVAREEYNHPTINHFRAITGLTAIELHQTVWARPELRDCDFCMEQNAPWIVNCRPFELTLGTMPGPVGGDHRPLVACDECVAMIRDNRKEQLVESSISKIIVRARTGANGAYIRTVVRSHPMRVLRAQVRPQVREVVYGMFANRHGFPERG